MRTVEFYMEMRRETELAYLFFDGICEVWNPKSQVAQLNHVKDKDYEVHVPEWLAKEKEII